LLEIHLQEQVAQLFGDRLRWRTRQSRGDEPLGSAILAALPCQGGGTGRRVGSNLIWTRMRRASRMA
jgi:hypothetical protein